MEKIILKNVEDVEKRLNELQRLRADLDTKTAGANKQIADIRDEVTEEISEIEETIKRIENAIEAWAEKKRDDDEIFPEGKKSLDLQAGTLAFRDSAPSLELIDGWDAKEVLEAIKDSTPEIKKAGIKTPEPTLDKTGLKKLHQKGKIDDETLKAFGLEMVTEESFSITLNTVESYAKK